MRPIHFFWTVTTSRDRSVAGVAAPVRKIWRLLDKVLADLVSVLGITRFPLFEQRDQKGDREHDSH